MGLHKHKRASIGLNLMVLVNAAHVIGLLYSPTTKKRRGTKGLLFLF
ncbi:unnamed protein product [Arabidopsis thaliana]|uniref:Transmembrane protein n=4 Tax=Arabidopsis TaxID=3701 RepID=A0A654FWP7_ARATH|nr:uncharacterized protein AT4G38405 [Arabidopsis thaliana]KAG7618868.1 hypothetical protein ISN45_At04g040800 [Arabidopsis thaliana x Arabidopsis arenosa]KAG7623342.1 hypothetical protein ISN44_As04g040510 [Arabidopsis suecica]AEE86925.1 transmembrane protein [Arabidopsis thaliana]CAA0397903.1 unnamed protein product [Arabidopsis thaliana]VYS65295.1 unnamed protein product [Arabidopsis thaliana]|eukprot:NP_001119139.1 transmembrane protein [Arabidopsis thaliana]